MLLADVVLAASATLGVARMGLAGLFMLCILVVVHETGHFLVAKLFRVGVPVYSIGMGPRLFGFRWRGTDYRVSALPIGGYVRMAGADPFGEEDPDAVVDPDQDFMKKPVWQRLLIMVAGPAFNLMLPFVLFTAVMMAGEPQADPSIGTVLPGTPAEQAGLRPGDVVKAVNGEPVDVFIEINDVLEADPEGPVEMVVARDGAERAVRLPLETVPLTPEGFVDFEKLGIQSSRMSTRIGIADPTAPAYRAGLRTGDAIVAVDGRAVDTWEQLRDALAAGDRHEVDVVHPTEAGELEEKKLVLEADPAWSPPAWETHPDRFGVLPIVLFVGSVSPDSRAAEAGVREDDRLLAVDGQPVRTWVDLIHLVAATAEEPKEGVEPRKLALSLVRDGQVHELSFAPAMVREVVGGEPRYRPVMGIGRYPDAFIPGPQINKYYSFPEAAGRAVEETGMLFRQTVGVLGNLVTRELKVQESLGGPIEIFRMAGQAAERGIYFYLRMIGMISISLGVINLLPVPVLDGGQILFYAIEGIRGRPLSVALRERIQMVGVLALIALMLMVFVFDVNRWLNSAG